MHKYAFREYKDYTKNILQSQQNLSHITISNPYRSHNLFLVPLMIEKEVNENMFSNIFAVATSSVTVALGV